MVTHASLFETIQRLKAIKNVPKEKLQVILTKDSIEQLLNAEVEFMDIKPGQVVQQTDMFFAGIRVYLGGQDRVQVIESEVYL